MTKPETTLSVHPVVAVYVCGMVRKNNAVLLLYRSHTKHHTNVWEMPGGNLDHNETIIDAVRRELHEELGIEVDTSALTLVHVLHTHGTDTHKIGFYFVADTWHGQPYNKEPHKHREIAWFTLDALPEDISASARQVLRHVTQTNNNLISTMF